jgi:tetratricopeptide (TPR) repeat protein
VLGRSFEFGLLVRMTGEANSNEDTTLDLLEEALRTGLLTEEVNGNRIVYHFWHPLIVSHLYERLSAARRAQLHRRAAQALIELHSGNEAKEATAIAYHLSKYDQDKQALAYYTEIAGNQAMVLSAYPEALHYYRQAMEALQALHASTQAAEQDALHIANLLECMAECNYMLGNAAEARQQYAHALELHQAQQKNASMFPSLEAFHAWQREEAQVQSILWRSIGRSWKYIGEFGHAHECAERGKEVLRAANITTGSAWACLHQLDGSTCWMEGNFSEARRFLEESLRIHEETMRKHQENADGEQAGLAYRHEMPLPLMTHSRRALLGDPLELGRTHESFGVVAASMAQYNEALQHLHTALAIFEKHDLVGAMSQVCSNIGAVHSMRTENTIATTYFKRALELSERTGDRRIKLLVTGNLGDIAARHGDLQEAAAWMTESLAWARQTSNREHISWALVTLATVQQDQGDMREALESIRRALVEARNIKSTTRIGFALVALANWRVARAMVLSQQAETLLPDSLDIKRADSERLRLLRSARAALERALQLSGIDTETDCTSQIVLTAIYYYQGDLEQARQQVQKALEEARVSEMMHLVGRAQRLKAEILLASNREKEADAAFEEALQTCKDHNLRLDYARTLYRYGQSLCARSLHVKSGRGGSAASTTSLVRAGFDRLQEARTIFTHCQAGLDLQRAEELLASPLFQYEEV